MFASTAGYPCASMATRKRKSFFGNVCIFLATCVCMFHAASSNYDYERDRRGLGRPVFWEGEGWVGGGKERNCRIWLLKSRTDNRKETKKPTQPRVNTCKVRDRFASVMFDRALLLTWLRHSVCNAVEISRVRCAVIAFKPQYKFAT